MQIKQEKDQIAKRLGQEKIIAVVVFEREQEVAPTIESLLEGGVAAIELALRSSYALSAVELVRRNYPHILLGVGTVLTSTQIKQLSGLADFAVAPGMNRRVIEAAIESKLPFYPGISTASELESTLEYGIRMVKFFPAQPLGGISYLESMHAPYAHLGLHYMPLGGINPQNLGNYVQSPIVTAVGGSWIASRTLIVAEDWDGIRFHAEKAKSICNEIEKKI